MRIRIAKSFGVYKVGQEFDWADGMARVMVARGLIVPVDESPKPVKPEPEPKVEEAVDEPAVERATHQPRRKRR